MPRAIAIVCLLYKHGQGMPHDYAKAMEGYKLAEQQSSDPNVRKLARQEIAKILAAQARQ